jgi:alkanesulfonate monooxygenase SsuD/methylene tetrahydromethanopterin reductase-like flavin-dependent oxidoreductase (luciferase family)
VRGLAQAAHEELKARLQRSTAAAVAAAADRDAAKAAAEAHLVQCEASHEALEAALAQLRNDVASERAEKEQLLVAHGEAMGEAEAMVRMTFPAQLLGGVGVVALVGMPVNHPLDRSQRYGGRHGGDGGRGACV